MLETVICLGLGSLAIRMVNKVKQARMVKRAMNQSTQEVESKFSDHTERSVVRMTVFLTEKETEALDSAVGEFLSERMLNEKEASSVLTKRNKK